jgi:DNA-binding NarL/FixJ family response regulator
MALYRAAPAEVVILDIFKPDKDGLETIIELRREFPHVSVVAMSGHRAVDLMLNVAKDLGAVRTLREACIRRRLDGNPSVRCSS